MSLEKRFPGAQGKGARFSLALAALFLLSACGGSTGPVDGNPPDGDPPDGGGPPGGPTRGFRMGFTPFPYAATAEAIDDVSAQLWANGDVIAHHPMAESRGRRPGRGRPTIRPWRRSSRTG